MAQAVFIATEVPVSTVSRKPALLADDSKAEAFATELNRLIDDKPASKPETKAVETEAASQTETEKTTEDDGNILPTNAQPAVSEAELDETASTPAEPSETNVDKTTDSVIDLSADLALDSEQPESSSTTEAPKDSSMAKPVPTATELTQLDTAVPVVTPVVRDKLTAASETNKAVAVALALDEKAVKQPTSLRADILNALNKQQKTETNGAQQTVRTALAEQATQQHQHENVVTKTARVELPLPDMPLTERPASSTSPLTGQTATSTLLTAASTPTMANTTTAAPTLTVQPNMQHAAWGQVMSSRVVWMAKEGVQQAEIKLNPANMGPVEVRLHIHNDQANVTFLAQQAATRDALEQALPRLRESFAEAGLQLGNAQVGEQAQQQQQQAEHSGSSHIFSQAGVISVDTEVEAEQSTPSGTVAAGLSLYA